MLRRQTVFNQTETEIQGEIAPFSVLTYFSSSASHLVKHFPFLPTTRCFQLSGGASQARHGCESVDPADYLLAPMAT